MHAQRAGIRPIVGNDGTAPALATARVVAAWRRTRAVFVLLPPFGEALREYGFNLVKS